MNGRFVIGKATAEGETLSVELLNPEPAELEAAFNSLDARLIEMNRRVMATMQFTRSLPPAVAQVVHNAIDILTGRKDLESLIRLTQDARVVEEFETFERAAQEAGLRVVQGGKK